MKGPFLTADCLHFHSYLWVFHRWGHRWWTCRGWLSDQPLVLAPGRHKTPSHWALQATTAGWCWWRVTCLPTPSMTHWFSSNPPREIMSAGTKVRDYMLHFLMIIWPEIHLLFFFSFTTTISFNSPNSKHNTSLFCHPPFLEAGIFAALPGQNWPVCLWATRLYFLPGFCSNAGCCRSSLCSSLSSDRPPPHGASPPHTAGLHTITQIICHYPINMVILDDKFFHLWVGGGLLLTLLACMFMQAYAKAAGQIYMKILAKVGLSPSHSRSQYQ